MAETPETIIVNQAASSGAEIAVDAVGSAAVQVVKIGLGADGAIDNYLDAGQQVMSVSVPVAIASDQSNVPVSAAELDTIAGAVSGARMQVSDGGNSLTVDNAELVILAAAVSGSAMEIFNADLTTLAGAVSGSVMQISDGGNSITVDGTVLDTISGNIATIEAAVSASAMIVSDGGGSITIDGSVGVTGGIRVSGAVQVSSGELDTIAAAVSGSVMQISDGGNLISVDDGGGTITVDNPTLTSLLAAVSASALNINGTLVAGSAHTTNDVGAGNAGADTIRVVIASDQVNVAVSAATLTTLAATVSGGRVQISDGGNLISVDDGAGSLTVDNPTLTALLAAVSASAVEVFGSDLASIASNTSTIAGAVSGGVVQISDGGNAITIDGAVTNSVLTAWDVTEDLQHQSGQRGVMTLAVRNDDLASLSSTDGDYSPLEVGENGAMYVTSQAADNTNFAPVDVSASGGVSIVATVSGHRVRVTNIVVIAAATANIYFASGSAGGALTGEMEVRPATGFAPGYDPTGHFETVSDQALLLVSDQNAQLGGWVKYTTVV